jgi:sugar lactone lactonase YvrE
MTTLSPVLDKGYFFEGARWHDGRLWVSDFFGMAAMGEMRVGADGIVADSQGGVWVADSLHNRAIRVEEGGAVTDEVSTGEFGCYSCALGGAQGDTLFLCVAPDFSAELRSAAAESHVVTVAVDVPA